MNITADLISQGQALPFGSSSVCEQPDAFYALNQFVDWPCSDLVQGVQNVAREALAFLPNQPCLSYVGNSKERANKVLNALRQIQENSEVSSKLYNFILQLRILTGQINTEELGHILYRSLTKNNEENTQTLQTVLNAGANVNLNSSDWRATPLELAITKGHHFYVSLLIAAGAKVDLSTLTLAEYHKNPTIIKLVRAEFLKQEPHEAFLKLSDAVGQGNLDTVRSWIESGASPNFRGNQSMPLIFFAMVRKSEVVTPKHIQVLEYLIECGADINATPKQTQSGQLNWATALFIAIQLANPTLVELFIHHGAGLGDSHAVASYIRDETSMEADPKRYENLTQILAKLGDAAVSQFKNLKTHPIVCEDFPEKALFSAIYKNQLPSAVEILRNLKDQSYLEARDSYGNTLLNAAAILTNIDESYASIIKYLVSLGLDPNALDVSGELPLNRAIKSGDLKALETLLEAKNVDVNLKGKGERSPLFVAVSEGQTEMVKLLLFSGATLFSKRPSSIEGEKNLAQLHPLALAASKKEYEILNLLLSYLPQNLTDEELSFLDAPMKIAFQQDDPEILKMIADRVSNYSLETWGYGWFNIAVLHNAKHIIKAFVQDLNFNVNELRYREFDPVMPFVYPPLFTAIEKNNLEMVRFLVEEIGADVNLKVQLENRIYTLLDFLARFEDRQEITSYLLSKGLGRYSKSEL